jgi:hypothetical protein
VTWFEPHLLAELPRFERKARYLLPLAEGWLRATVYWDRTLEKERLVLTSRRPGRGDPGPPIVQPQALVDRMPLAPAGATQRSFRRAAPALVAGDIPAALILAADDEMEPDAETRALLGAGAAA